MILCADDFGMADDIDRAVLDLVDGAKLTAVSCAVAHPACRAERVRALAAPDRDLDVGLHLVLTCDGRPVAPLPTSPLAVRGQFPTFRGLLLRAGAHRLDRAELQSQIAAQYECLAAILGRPPDFIDGHLHVHQLPVIRDALLDFMSGLPLGTQPYVRNTRMSGPQIRSRGMDFFKCLAIGLPGAAFSRRARRRGIATNHGFAGVYTYHPRADFSRRVVGFVRHLPSANGLLMVHPGLYEDWRRREYEFLAAWNVPPNTLNRFLRNGQSELAAATPSA